MSAPSVKSTPPSFFKITDSTKLEDWKKWQRSFRYYANAINLEQKSHDVQLSTFKSLIGPDALEIYNTFSILDITDVESVISKFDDHFKPKANVTLERYNLYKLRQKSGQKFDDFLTDVTNQVNKCEFKSLRDEIVLYKIVGGIDNDEVRDVLLADADLKFEKAVQICRATTSIFISGKENVKLCKTPKASYKEARRLLLESTEKDQKIGLEMKMKTSKNDQKQSDVGKLVGKGPKSDENGHKQSAKKTKKAASIENSSRESSKQSDSVENSAFKDEVGSNGGDSDWRADDFDDDDDDDYNPGNTEIVARKQRSRKNAARKSGEPSETPVKIENFPCETCGKVVGTRRDLRRHIMTHAESKKVTCHHCGRRFKQKRYLLRHIVRSHPGTIDSIVPKVYICDVCGYKTNQATNLRRHKYQHTDDRPFSCELCEYKCIVPRLMKAHMAKHTGERPHVCSVCQKGFVESAALKKHLLKHMSPEERENYLATDNESSRVGESRVTCETCGKVLSSRGALKSHSVVHTGERPFACNVCNYRAAQKAALTAHMAIHSDEKPFVCTVCGYACKLNRILLIHMRTHTGHRPHACKMCDSKFRQVAHLIVHMRTHTGEKPYVCDICGHRWAKQSNLTQHMKIHLGMMSDGQYNPPRKRQKKRKTDAPIDEPPPAPAPANAIPQWSEQVSTINPMECFLNLETPPPFHPTYPALQPNPRPPDCRYYEQRQ